MSKQVVARMWGCGDICFCEHPEVFVYDSEHGRKTLWLGQSYNNATRMEIAEMLRELRREAKKYGVKVRGDRFQNRWVKEVPNDLWAS